MAERAGPSSATSLATRRPSVLVAPPADQRFLMPLGATRRGFEDAQIRTSRLEPPVRQDRRFEDGLPGFDCVVSGGKSDIAARTTECRGTALRRRVPSVDPSAIGREFSDTWQVVRDAWSSPVSADRRSTCPAGRGGRRPDRRRRPGRHEEWRQQVAVPGQDCRLGRREGGRGARRGGAAAIGADKVAPSAPPSSGCRGKPGDRPVSGATGHAPVPRSPVGRPLRRYVSVRRESGSWHGCRPLRGTTSPAVTAGPGVQMP